MGFTDKEIFRDPRAVAMHSRGEDGNWLGWGGEVAIEADASAPTDYEIVRVTTDGDGYEAITFSQPVRFFRVKAVDGNARFRKAQDAGDYASLAYGEVLTIFAALDGATVGYAAREGSTDITVEAIGYF